MRFFSKHQFKYLFNNFSLQINDFVVEFSKLVFRFFSNSVVTKTTRKRNGEKRKICRKVYKNYKIVSENRLLLSAIESKSYRQNLIEIAQKFRFKPLYFDTDYL